MKKSWSYNIPTHFALLYITSWLHQLKNVHRKKNPPFHALFILKLLVYSIDSRKKRQICCQSFYLHYCMHFLWNCYDIIRQWNGILQPATVKISLLKYFLSTHKEILQYRLYIIFKTCLRNHLTKNIFFGHITMHSHKCYAFNQSTSLISLQSSYFSGLWKGPKYFFNKVIETTALKLWE